MLLTTCSNVAIEQVKREGGEEIANDCGLVQKAERALGGAIRAPSVYTVRDVAPNKVR